MTESITELTGVAQLLAAFVAGLFTSFTPCVYPLIPVTLSLFGARGEGSAARGFGLALVYVLGICATYTALGYVSATSGILFGAALGNPYVVVGVCMLLILLSLFTLDVLQFERVYVIQNKASQIGGRGVVGAFLMGLVSGVVAAPCVGPVLVVILGIVSQSKDPVWGSLLMFCYALGFGMLFLVLGTFSGLVSRMPRSGNWLNGVKFIIAVGLLVVALFLLRVLVPIPLTLEQWPIMLALAAVALLFATTGYRRNLGWRKVVASVFMALAVAGAIPGLGSSASESSRVRELHWQRGLAATLADAKIRNTIAMLDLYADWCAACIELDRLTFPEKSVQRVLETITVGRADFTEGDPESETITERYSVVGLPTILFLKSDGSEVPGSRITGFMPPDKFVTHLETVIERAHR